MDFKQYLSSLRGRTIYYRPNPGNGGDALIAAGTIRILSKLKMDFILVDDDMDLTGKTVLLGGGGNLTEQYDFCAEFIRKWYSKVRTFILAPHTISGHGQLLSELTGDIVLFCREKRSYEYVRRTVGPEVNVYLDHDLAFHLESREVIAGLAYKPIVLYLQTIIRKKFMDTRTLYVFRRDLEKTVFTPPLDNNDVSTKINYCWGQDNIELVQRTVGEFLRFIDFFKIVHTNRLHIAIAGYLLDKQVFMYPNSYYKNRAVYEFSLAAEKNVTFCDRLE